jgi:hypothetical protein
MGNEFNHMSGVDEIPFQVAFGIFWLANFALRTYFQSKAKGNQIAMTKHVHRAKMFFRLLAFSYLLMLIYIFSSWISFAHIPIPVLVR